MAQQEKNGPAKKGPAKKGPAPPAMKGVVASAAGGLAVHGPAGPAKKPGPRGALCELLKLRDPSDVELFRSAVVWINELEAEIAELDKKAR